MSIFDELSQDFDRSNDEAICKHMGEECDVKDLEKTPKQKAGFVDSLLESVSELENFDF
jgi:hypothetical protein